jgi:inorganic pyrophosphatase
MSITQKLAILSSFFLSDFSALARSNPIFITPDTKLLKPDEIYFTVEIPQGSTYKFELRTPTGRLINDRILCPKEVPGKKGVYVRGYPAAYGITSGRFNVDKDPLDVLTLGSDEDYWRQVILNQPTPRSVKVIGLLKFEECDEPPCQEKDWEQDWKVIAVDSSDYFYSRFNEISELPQTDLDALTLFLSNYKGNKNGLSFTRVSGSVSKKEALAWLGKNFPVSSAQDYAKEEQSCRKIYRSIYDSRDKLGKTPEKNEAFVNCVQRVHDSVFYPGDPAFQFFLYYTAYQFALTLKEQPESIQASASIMEKRKREGKKYYRFVGRDVQDPPGTGNAIYEWVLTKPVSAGCMKDWPGQYYDDQEIVNF